MTPTLCDFQRNVVIGVKNILINPKFKRLEFIFLATTKSMFTTATINIGLGRRPNEIKHNIKSILYLKYN